MYQFKVYHPVKKLEQFARVFQGVIALMANVELGIVPKRLEPAFAAEGGVMVNGHEIIIGNDHSGNGYVVDSFGGYRSDGSPEEVAVALAIDCLLEAIDWENIGSSMEAHVLRSTKLTQEDSRQLLRQFIQNPYGDYLNSFLLLR